MEAIEIHSIPVSELKVREDYRNLLPRHKDIEFLRLMSSKEIKGLLPDFPIVVNQDLVFLDGHARLQIAKELGLEWAWVIIREFEDHYEEKLYILETALAPYSNPEAKADLEREIAQIEAEGGVIDPEVARGARQTGLSYRFYLKVIKIKEAAVNNPEIAEAWDMMVKGETPGEDSEIEDLYQKTLQKENARFKN